MAEVFSWREAPPGDYAVIGDPIAHSKSPAMHAAAYRALGLDLTYRAIHVPVGEVPEALEHLRNLGYRGVNVTVPHKEAALAWTRHRDHQAISTGTANTIQLPYRSASNTDVMGFKGSLRDLPFWPKRTLILGAGGSAASVLLALNGLTSPTIWNRNPERAERLLRSLRENLVAARAVADEKRMERGLPHPDASLAKELAGLERVELAATPDLTGYDLIVNATPASLRGDDLGLDWSRSNTEAIAYDLAYNVDDAPFLSGAREAGRHTKDGKDMLATQGAASIVIWGDRAFGTTAMPGICIENRAPGAPDVSMFSLSAVMREALD